MAKLRGAMVHSRLAVAAAREELIESLGDFMCGSGGTPPAWPEIEALDRLREAQLAAEAAYARCLQAQSEHLMIRLRRWAG